MTKVRIIEWVCLTLAAVLMFVSLTCEGRAQGLMRTRGGLTALELARVCINEDSRPFRNGGLVTEDCLGIIQTAVTVKETYGHPTVLSALRRLAPHVTKQRPAKIRRHAMSGSLPGVGMLKPVLWIEALDGPWRRYGPNWVRFRAGVRKAVKEGFVPPCPQPPIAWGGVMDDHIAISRGLTRMECGERNRFWRR